MNHLVITQEKGVEMSDIISTLRQLQADSLVLFVKLHNYHWHVRGSDFFQVHAETQKIYEIFADVFDDLAERIVQLEGKPVVTLSEALSVAKITEENATFFRSKEIFSSILKDYEYLLSTFSKLSKLSEEQGDKSTGNYADEQIAHLQKSIWMFRALQS